MEKLGLSVVLAFMLLSIPLIAQQKENAIPDNVISIEKENTKQISDNNEETTEPNKEVKELLKTSDIKIENPALIQLLNETSIKPTPFSFGYRADVFLGNWPLHYKMKEQKTEWQFQQINTNEYNNQNGEKKQTLYYHQLEESRIVGALTSKVKGTNQLQQMILAKVKEKEKLPVSFAATVGKDTRLSQTYDVPVGKRGTLKAYMPAVKATGEATYGEVYIQLKGTKKQIVIKNVTKQEVNAFLPVSNHLYFQYSQTDN